MIEGRNLYRVPKRKWRQWSPVARRVFNATFGAMTKRPDCFQAPSLERVKVQPRSWRVTAWNAAWIAADEVRLAERGVAA